MEARVLKVGTEGRWGQMGPHGRASKVLEKGPVEALTSTRKTSPEELCDLTVAALRKAAQISWEVESR